ncbi:AEC family transporter [Francisellaceae bacterium]|nr:AEC family transporter [Francisellaceae bacterium]
MTQLIVSAILPVFILIFLGWLTVKIKLVGQDAHKTCASLVTYYVFPALLFVNTASAKPSQILDIKWMGAFLLSISVIWIICFLVGRRCFKESVRDSVMQSMLCTFTDMGGMGIPFLMQIIGSAALISVAKANFVVSLTLIPITIFLLEMHSESTKSKGQIILYALFKSFKKPMFLAVVIGAMISFTGVYTSMPSVAINTMKHISNACVFVSLFTVGLALYGIRLRLSLLFIFNLIMKSLISGFIAWGIVLMFGISGDAGKELVYLVALPTATIATIFALQWRALPEEATSLYLSTTVLSLITLPMWMYLLS